MYNFADIQQYCKPYFTRHDIRLTKKKLIILQEMMEMDRYIDAESLFLMLRKKHRVSYSTVYGILRQLNQMGLLAVRTEGKGKKARFRPKKKIILDKKQMVC